MNRICVECDKNLGNQPAILISGFQYCFHCAKREYPRALENWESIEAQKRLRFQQQKDEYDRKKNQSEEVHTAFHRKCYPGFWRALASGWFLFFWIVLGIITFSYCAEKIAHSIGKSSMLAGVKYAIDQFPPLVLVFLFVILLFTFFLLRYFLFCWLKLLTCVLEEKHDRFCKNNPFPPVFKEEIPVAPLISQKPSLEMDEDNDDPSLVASGYNRIAILSRDGYSCQNCGEHFQNKFLEVHHVNPRAKGGSDAETNLITLCLKCHVEEDWFDHFHVERGRR